MTPMAKLTTLALAACISINLVWAQEPDYKTAGEKKTLPGTTGEKDPTQPGPLLKDLLGKGKTEVVLPSLLPKLKGRVLQRGKEPAAMLEVDGTLVVVGRNSIVTTRGGASLKIMEITAAEVRIEMQPSQEKIILR